ncbi:MAG: hypothetical protein HC794_08190 [Nitrospiraceae bacterium]|nr:hypothetical protein [Nitrospiraceae bacterium]
MYAYDHFDETLVRERVAEFRGQVARRLSGEISEEEFKPLRLMNGLYLQLHAYMLRIAIPYGVLSPKQLRQLAMIADKLNAAACVVVDGNVKSADEHWPELLVDPIINKGVDCVLPWFLRNRYEGTLTNTLLAPLTAALYGEAAFPIIWGGHMPFRPT